MLEQLFGSKTRVKLLRLFLTQETADDFYVREITRKIGEHINSVRRELENLKSLGIIVEATEFRSDLARGGAESKGVSAGSPKKYFRVNTDFILYPELRDLLFKSHFLFEKFLAGKIRDLGQARYLALTGFFTGNSEAKTDILIVGKVSREKIAALIRQFEGKLGRDVNYTVMSLQEFRLRKELTDRFLFDILENKKIVLIDKLK